MVSEPQVIRPSPRWRAANLAEIWDFRDLFLILGARDIRLRYRQTALGVAWVVLQPLMGAAIFAFVFGKVAGLGSGGAPYFLLALVGMVLWNAFSGVLTRANSSLVNNAALVSKVYFPRLILPASSVVAVALDATVGLLLIGLSMAAYGVAPSWRILSLPPLLILAGALALGLGLFTSALTVRYRDVQHVLPILVQLGFYATPVAYSVTAVPERFRPLVLLNPVAPLMEAARWSIFGRAALATGDLAYTVLVTIAVVWLGAIFFRGAERAFADVI